MHRLKKIQQNLTTFASGLMLFLAIAGILQFLLQFIIGWENAFFLDTKLPQAFIMQGFNGLNKYSASIYKSNGFFLNEASTFSQFLALGIIIEMLYFKNWKVLTLFVAAYLTTFSGTGLIILGLLTPTYMIQRRMFIPLVIILTIGITSPIWAPWVGMEAMLNRATEITNTHTSGFARFISPFLILRDLTFQHEVTAFFGMGAGSTRFAQAEVSYGFFDPSWVKIMYEYGIIGFLLYYMFMGYMLSRSKLSNYVKLALAIAFLFLNEYAMPPNLHSLIVGLLVWPSRDKSMTNPEPQSEAA